MDAGKEREIIHLWHRLRLLEREGRPTTAIRSQIEKALAERERHAGRSNPIRNRADAHQASRQRREILQLQRAGINSLPAEALLARVLANIDNLCAERDKLRREQPLKPKVLGGRSW
jgi:hypothetical protein